MFDVGFWELIILFGLGLIILGPERLPKVAMQLGNWAGQARRMARTLTAQIRDELEIDVNKPFNTTYTPKKRPQPDYQRPGLDDLKPQDAPQADAPAEGDPPRTDAAGMTDDWIEKARSDGSGNKDDT
jgi:sec-independent protein translocase protein TatB